MIRAKLLVLSVFFTFSFFSQNEFIKNEGQLIDFDKNNHPEIQFYKKGNGLDVYFTKKGVSYYFSEENLKYETNFDSKEEEKEFFKRYAKDSTFYYRMDMIFLNANPNLKVSTKKVEDFYYNFYYPHCSNGLLQVEASSKIIYENVYNNINFEFYFFKGKLKYDIVLKPNAQINDIKLFFDGAENIVLEKNELLINSPIGKIKETLPRSFIQKEGESIDKEVKYSLENNVVSFNLDYNNANTLVIDPQITWSTYYDNRNIVNRYQDVRDDQFVITQYSFSGFSLPTLSPGGSGYYQNTNGGLNDITILKFDTSGVRQWCTYYGGSDYDYSYGVAINSIGDIIVSGTSESTDIPTQNAGGGAYFDGSYTQGAGPFFSGTWDYTAAFIIRFNSAGVRSWATHYDYLEYSEIEIDNNDNVYLVGNSRYDTPPVLNPGGGAYYQPTVTIKASFPNPAANNASGDLFILKFNSNNQRIWATNLGGDCSDGIVDFEIDNNNNLFILAGSDNFSGTAAGFPKLNAGGGAYYDGLLGNPGTDRNELLLYKFSPTGVMNWGTAFGGSLNELASNGSLAIDNNNNIFVFAGTRSTDLPLVNPGGGAHFDNTINATGSNYSYFIARFNSSLQLDYSTYYYSNTFSGNFPTYITTTVDNKLILGITAHDNLYPITPRAGAYSQTYLGGGRDMHIAEFAPNMSISWSTYLGSNQNEVISGLNVTNNAAYSLFVTGHDGYDNVYPLVNPGGGAYFDNTGYNGSEYSFYITKMMSVVCDTTTNTTSVTDICESGTKTLVGTPVGGVWSVVSGGGTIAGTTYTPANVSTNTNVTVQYKIPAVGTCPADSTSVTFTVNFQDTANILTDTNLVCVGGSKTLSATPAGGTWTAPGAGTLVPGSYIPPNLLPGGSITETLIYTLPANGACAASADTISFLVVRDSTVVITSSAASICEDATLNLTALPAGGTWTVVSGPGTETGGVLTPTGAGTVKIEYAVLGACGNAIDTMNIVINPLPNADAGLDENICAGDTITLTATGGGTYQWVPGPAVVNQQVYPIITTGYRVDVTSDSGCIASDSVTVFVVTPSGATATDDQAIVTTGTQEIIDVYSNDIGAVSSIQVLTGPFNGTATVSGGNVTYQSTLGYIGMDSLIYQICDASCQTVCDTAMLLIQVDHDLIIPIGVSVNGDGKNDVFNVLGLNKYTDNSLSIFNRWGSLIFEAKPYQNDWDGQNTSGSVTGNEVITGTYFYILKLGEGLPSYNGYIELKK